MGENGGLENRECYLNIEKNEGRRVFQNPMKSIKSKDKCGVKICSIGPS